MDQTLATNHSAMRPAAGAKWRRSMLRVATSPISVIMLAALLYLLATRSYPALRWLVLDADWNGTTRESCTSGGACWVFLRVHIGQFLFGFYPADERWRVITGFGLPALAAAMLFLPGFPHRTRLAYALVLLGPVFSLALFTGGFAELP